MKEILWLMAALIFNLPVRAQKVIPLYEGAIEGAIPSADSETSVPGPDGKPRISRVSRPTLTIYLPQKGRGSGASVIICPGGGYGRLAIGHEGYDVAEALQAMGIAAFVLKYRLPDDRIMKDKSIGPLQDAQRAIQLVRYLAPAYSLDPGKVGIMGFSAGGHLAAMAGTRFSHPVIPMISKPLNHTRISLRPDFIILLYPVISMTDNLAHKGSRENLLGKSPADSVIIVYSAELNVTGRTPPAFLVHAANDSTVKVANTKAFCKALRDHNVACELHIYSGGGHGFGMHNPTAGEEWMDLLKHWLKAGGWLR